jgi:hypothetical protein
MNKFITIITLVTHYHVLGFKRLWTGLKIKAILA